jgi:6-phosphogluconolactonase
MGATIAPEKILKELAELWVDSGKQEQADGGAGVLRACSMTLVVLAEAGGDTQDFGETIAALMPEHPARTVLVRLSGAGDRSLEGRVYSQCWMPFGQRRQICCEQVEITVSDAGLADLRSVVLPLMVADLPLIVWCRSARLLAMPEFRAIAEMAQKVVLDSAAVAGEAPDALRRARNLAASGVMLGDLAWTRLTRWREMLAQVFENQQNAAQLARIASIDVEWGGSYHALALYLGAWVRDSLARLGLNPSLGFSRAPDGNSLRVRLTGEGIAVELVREDDRMVVTVNGASQCTNLPKPTDYLLMREELGIVRHDPVFESALVSAERLAHPIRVMSLQKVIAPDAQWAADACAKHILGLVETALAARGRASLAISGGSTPKLMFQTMAKMPFAWDRINLFFVDERCVPPADSASNYKLANENLIAPAQIPAANVHRVMGELAPTEAAERYAAEIREFFGLQAGEMPQFDIVHRGMGPDAHTASLFPGDPLIDDRTGITAATFASKFNQWRVTLLPGVLLAARNTVFLVAGEDKVEALRAVFHEAYDPKKYPSQLGNDGNSVAWFLDEAAAKGLS